MCRRVTCNVKSKPKWGEDGLYIRGWHAQCMGCQSMSGMKMAMWKGQKSGSCNSLQCIEAQVN